MLCPGVRGRQSDGATSLYFSAAPRRGLSPHARSSPRRRRAASASSCNRARKAPIRGFLDAFVQALKETGWVEGQNVIFERRFADGKEELLANLAAELVQLRVDAIVTDSNSSARAARTPRRPYRSSWPQAAMRLRMGWWPLPQTRRQCYRNEYPDERPDRQAAATTDRDGSQSQTCGLLMNPSDLGQVSQLREAKTAAQSLGVELHVAEASTPDKFDSAFAAISKSHAQALFVLQSAMFFNQHPRIVAFAMASRLPALFAEREVAEAGGLMAYGPSIPALFRRAAVYVDKIFRGADPAELPIELSTAFEFVINLKTAKALGLTVPDKLLSTADEVID